MSYTPPAGDSIVAQFGSGYAPPAGDAIAAQFDGAGTPAGTIAATLAITGEFLATTSAPTVTAAVDADLAIAGGVQATHGVAGAAGATLVLDADVQARHGVAGAAVSTLVLTGAAQAVHPRYVLEGEVRDNGVLVDRRVRAYRRSDGALVTEGDTASGHFLLNAGWSVDEFFLVPIDLGSDATDWAPPCANRVLSVLVAD